jgi:hypothetical protein
MAVKKEFKGDLRMTVSLHDASVGVYTRSFTGQALILTFSVPQFFLHVTTAYDILRHAGVDLAKKDFLGPPRQPDV